MKKILLSLLLCVILGVGIYVFKTCSDKEPADSQSTAASAVETTDQHPEKQRKGRLRAIEGHLDHMEDVSGHRVGLKPFEGKYVLLHFWNTRDTSYLTEIPKFQYLSNKDKAGRTVYASVFCRDASAGESAEDGLRIFKQKNWTLPFYSVPADDKGLQEMQLPAQPVLFLISPKNHIVFTGTVNEFTAKMEASQQLMKQR